MTSSVEVGVDDVVVAAVSHGLDGGASWPAEPLTEAAFSRVLQLGRKHRIVGALAEAASDGALALLPEQRDQLAEQHEPWQSHALMLEQLLLRTARAFDRGGIDFRVLKGAALAHLVYADPSWRTAADLDLLVPSHQFDAAVTIALHELGGEEALPELRPGFDAEFGKESLVRIGSLELDLHRTFVTGPFGLTIDLDELFAGRTDVAIGGENLPALSAEHQFLHACYNTALGDYPVRLSAVRDLLLCRHHLDVDLDAVIGTAARWHGTAVAQRAAALVIDTVGPDRAGDFTTLAALTVPRREALMMRSYLTPARSYSRQLASLAVIPGIRARYRYARALLAPSESYLESRGWTGRTHLERAIGRLRKHA